tara:strand:+ start:205 stop:612 length:408 start_codon:yes stop_codon:yes gene_type:complete
MLLFKNMKNWKKINMKVTQAKHVPKSKGVYLILKVENWIYNIPIGLKVLYVGIGNLRRRFQDHISIRREHNKDLAREIQRGNLEFWFVEKELSELRKTEDFLIEEFTKVNPKLTNIINKPKITIGKTKGEINHVR